MSTSIKRMKEQAADPNLVLTPHINQWLLEHGDEGYDEQIIARLLRLLTKKPRVRSGSFSGSAGATCYRAQVFGYLGVKPNQAIQPQLINLFSDGKWRHLRWQAMLLSAGLLTDVEVPISLAHKQTLGSMDGVGEVTFRTTDPTRQGKKYGFELKGMYPDGWDNLKRTGDISKKHKEQMSRYFLGSDLDFFVYIVENKSTQDWLEFIIERDEVMLDSANKELDALNLYVNEQTLPARLPICEQQIGGYKHTTIKRGFDASSESIYAFKNCGYGGAKTKSVCLAVHDWEQANAKN